MVEANASKADAELIKIGSNSKYCGKFGLTAVQNDEKVLLPLTKVSIKGELRGVRSTTEVELTYLNPSKDSPLECTYSFPIEPNTVLAKLEATINDCVIETKITSKESAAAKYEDAIAGGNAAIHAERKKKDEVLTVKLGNLLPGQTATLKQTILGQLEVISGFYCFKLPAAFFPDYKKLGAKGGEDGFAYDFAYEVRIKAEHSVSSISVPENAAIVEQNETRTDVLVRGTEPGRTVNLYYRTMDMLLPQLEYAQSPDSDQIAVSAALVPTFDQKQPQDFFEVMEDEKPDQVQLSSGSDFHFLFVVDRSGSMWSCNRMKLAIEALSIFIRSLPVDSTFSIISFGSDYEFLQDLNGKEHIPYNDSTKSYVLDRISSFEPDFGGTEILKPLKGAQNCDSDKLKRIFLLTDGDVDDPKATIAQARQKNDTCRVFSFGLGSGCDKNLVRKVAEAGRGTSTIVKDNDPNLNGLVVKALAAAIEPSLKDTQYGFNGELCSAREVYRNTLISETKLISQAEFENLTFCLKTVASESGEPLDQQFSRADFKQVEGAAGKSLFQTAVHSYLQSKIPSQIEKGELSKKFQVLCEETAIVGVMKQSDKVSGELQETEIKFGREAVSDYDSDNQGYGMASYAQQNMRMLYRNVSQGSSCQEEDEDDCEDVEMGMGMGMEMEMEMDMDVEMDREEAPVQKLRSQVRSIQRVEVQSMKMAKQESIESNEDDCFDLMDQQVQKSKSRAAPMNMKAMSMAAAPRMRSESPQGAMAASASSGKPDFNTIISYASSAGAWSAESRPTLFRCVAGGQDDDEAMLKTLSEVALSEGFDSESIYLTLLALYILREAYDDYEDEWQLVAKKATKWLQSAGIAKPNALIKAFTLNLLD